MFYNIIYFIFMSTLIKFANAGCTSNLGTCYQTLKGRDFSGWYNECTDKIDKMGGLGPWKAIAGDPKGQHCACVYTSSVPGAWGIARKSLKERVIDKNHECSSALYMNVCDYGEGQVTLQFNCY